jgi:hypothetical protein
LFLQEEKTNKVERGAQIVSIGQDTWVLLPVSQVRQLKDNETTSPTAANKLKLRESYRLISNSK